MDIIHDGQTIPMLDPKSVNARLRYRFRVDGLAEGETITSYSFWVNGQEFNSVDDVIDGLKFEATDSDLGDEAWLELSAGTLNKTYLITFRYSTPLVPLQEQSVKLPVRRV